MKKFLKNIAAFTLATFICYVLAICFLGELFPKQFKQSIRYKRFGGGHLYTRMQEVKQTSDVDILFLGTSHCYRGFDTRIFKNAGYSSFNMGSSIQTAVQTKALLEKYLDRLCPKLIVYEVNPVAFGSDGIESSVDLISNDHIDWATVKMAFEINHIKTYNTLIFALYRQITEIGSGQTEVKHYMNDTYINGGFVETTIAYYDGKTIFAPKRYEFNSQQLDAFDEILTILKEKRIAFVLVQAPITRDNYHSKTNNDEFDSMMRSKANYYNFNELAPLRDTIDFYDDNHLNQNGVKTFNRKLLEVIKNDRLLR